jgi:hexosaminidase
MMKNKIMGAVALLALALAVKPVSALAQNAKPFAIPEIREWKGAEGVLPLGTTVNLVAGEGTENVAKAFAGDLDVLCGMKANLAAKSKAQAGDIAFKLVADKKKKKNAEAYTISITDKVEVSSTSATGLYWATRTLLQMLDGKDKAELPKGVINDCPDFGVRGFMIDCGRKYIPMSYLRQLVKIMSYYKMNFLQVHLNDNGFPQFFEHDWNKTYAAFRLECDTYPGLTARDGSYTKAEFRDFQKEAMALGVEIVPEIDAPAHSLAFTHYDPELGSHKYGVDHLDITNPKSQQFLDALWNEYLEGDDPVFVGPRVDIGTDEYSNKDKEVVEIFRALTDHLIKYVESYGKQAVLWGSLTHAKGETPIKVDNVVMSLWSNGYAAPDSMLKLGYKCISIPDGLTYIVPHAGYYYDYLNHQYLYEHWTPNIVGSEKYTFPYDSKQILGGMFAVWNDHCGNGVSVKDIHHRLYPAMQTLSAKFWTGKNVTLPWAEFNEKRMTLSEAPGVNELGLLSKSAYDKTFAALNPNQTFSPDGKIEAGYDYSVEFDLEGAAEAKGTVLLQSPNAKLYIADPINGRMAYERDGYLFTFDYAPYSGEKAKICIEGNNKATYLYINGKLAEAKDGRTFFHEGNTHLKTLETLVMPLQSTGDFKSKITNFNLRNSLRYTK